MAAQYIISQEQTDEVKGDPSLILSVPIEQYRSDYTVLVPEGYNENWVTVIRPIGTEVLVDQMPISLSFTPFADQQWEMVYLPLEPGIHTFQADQADEPACLYDWNGCFIGNIGKNQQGSWQQLRRHGHFSIAKGGKSD